MHNLEIIQQVYAAFGRGDMPALFSFFASEIEWYPAEGHPLAPAGRPWVGIPSLTQNFFQKIGPEWETFGCSPLRYYDAGETIVVEGRYFGSHRKTGRKLDAQFCHLWTLGEGKVKSFRQYTDTARLQRAMGSESPPK